MKQIWKPVCFIKYLPTHLEYFIQSSNEVKATLLRLLCYIVGSGGSDYLPG